MPSDPIIMIGAGIAIAVIVGAALFRFVQKAKTSGSRKPSA